MSLAGSNADRPRGRPVGLGRRLRRHLAVAVVDLVGRRHQRATSPGRTRCGCRRRSAARHPTLGAGLLVVQCGRPLRRSRTTSRPGSVRASTTGPGYIERRYVPCVEDMGDTARTTPPKTGDQCWRSDNATLCLNGGGDRAGLPGGQGLARPQRGRLADREADRRAATATTTASTGRSPPPTAPSTSSACTACPGGVGGDTNSTWTVPVAGNHSGEPCQQSRLRRLVLRPRRGGGTSTTSSTSHGNTMSYWYAKETNKYARNLTDTDDVSYVRGGTLTRIDYGTWDRGTRATARSARTAQVLLRHRGPVRDHRLRHATTRRTGRTPRGTRSARRQHLCPSKYSPTFWTTKRLAKITTRVWDTTRRRRPGRTSTPGR